MAETVNMQQTEYDSVLEKLTTLHQEEIESAREIATKIQELCSINGEFYAEDISKKVNMMMQNVLDKILATYEMEFNDTCKVIENFELGIKTIDTI